VAGLRCYRPDMRWIVDHGEYERQHDALRRRVDWESPGRPPGSDWESGPIDPDEGWEPEQLPRAADLLRAIRRLRRH
jgi:hypothetical protein